MKTCKINAETVKVAKELYLLEKGEMSSIRGGDNEPNDTLMKDQDELE